jgi:hypothetical protein
LLLLLLVEKDPERIIDKCSSRIDLKLDAGKLCDGFFDYLLKKCKRLDNLSSYCEGLSSFKNKRSIQLSCTSNPPYQNDSKRVKYCLNYMIFNSLYSGMPLIISLNDTYMEPHGFLVWQYSVYNPNAVAVKLINISTNVINDGKNVGSVITNPDGTIFAVIGTAGADLHNFIGQAPYVVKQFQRFGFLDVNITSDGKIMKGTFYENRDGTDKDHFTITK